MNQSGEHVDEMKYRHLVYSIKSAATRRKYQRAFLKLAKLLKKNYKPIWHGGCNDDGEMCLYWDIGLHYCDIEVNPSGTRFTIFIKERKSEVRDAREWWFENVTLDDFEEEWLIRLLQPFRKA